VVRVVRAMLKKYSLDSKLISSSYTEVAVDSGLEQSPCNLNNSPTLKASAFLVRRKSLLKTSKRTKKPDPNLVVEDSHCH